MNIFNSDTTTITGSGGRRLVMDTDDLWEEFIIVVDSDIQNEFSGKSAPGGFTWNTRWVSSINALREGRENHQKYIDYIINQRRQHGLPELK